MAVLEKIRMLREDKPFLFACFSLFIILSIFYCRFHREIVIRPSIEERIFTEVNQLRIKQGLIVLTSDERLTEIARQHSLKMASGTTPFGHDNSTERFAAVTNMGVNWIAAAENVASATRFEDPATEALRCWLSSKSDQQNMQGNFNRTGISVTQNKTNGNYYITQIFVKVP